MRPVGEVRRLVGVVDTPFVIGQTLQLGLILGVQVLLLVDLEGARPGDLDMPPAERDRPPRVLVPGIDLVAEVLGIGTPGALDVLVPLVLLECTAVLTARPSSRSHFRHLAWLLILVVGERRPVQVGDGLVEHGRDVLVVLRVNAMGLLERLEDIHDADDVGPALGEDDLL